MNKIVLAALLISISGLADCTYQHENAKIGWKAFKTYEKIGVGGSFDRFSLKSKNSDSVDKLLMSSLITIDTTSVNSGNPGRDATLTQAFFNTQNVHSITAKVKSAKDGKALVDISMNGITKTIPMNYTVTATDTINGKGVIDLADFEMIPSLKSINASCFELHAGKTWQDVEIGFDIQLKKVCN